MCWTGKRFFERMPRIALRDIEVYKVLNKEGESPYQGYQYEFNQETKQISLKSNKCILPGTIEIPIMDLCVENAFIKRMVDWRDSLIATEVEMAKKEKSYDYQKFLDLKELFGE